LFILEIRIIQVLYSTAINKYLYYIMYWNYWST